MKYSLLLKQNILEYKREYMKDVKLILILSLIAIFVFGGKLFFYSLAPDDFSRFYSTGSEQASWLGRWMGGIINQHIFTASLQILPYFNGLLGVVAITLSGFVTAKFFQLHSRIEIGLITLLIVISPFIAHNFFFNTNVGVWLTTFLGVLGVTLFYSSSKTAKFVGLVCLVIAIGTYQTILQVVVIIIIFKTIIELLAVKDTRDLSQILRRSFMPMFLVFLAFMASSLINYSYISFNHLHTHGRYANKLMSTNLSYYIEKITLIYKITLNNLFGLQYFNKELKYLYQFEIILAVMALITMMARQKSKFSFKVFVVFILVVLLCLLPIVINLPVILGLSIPIRAYYTIDWVLAGFVIMQLAAFKSIGRAISMMAASSLLVVSAFYVNVFFHAAYRQTMSDITRANQIVTTIRNNPNYNSEPMQFKIVGEKSFAVKGWKLDFEALNTNWSKYGLFSNFTDFKYKGMSEESYNEVTRDLIERGELIKSYPAKNSIYVSGGKAVLYLNPIKINTAIKLEHFQEEKADINAYFDLYVRGKNIYYKKSPCTKSDIAHTFFLHVYPTKKSVLPQKLQKRGILYMDFRFSQFGKREGNSCIAVKELPSFDIEKIATGQYAHGKIDWSKVYSFKK